MTKLKTDLIQNNCSLPDNLKDAEYQTECRNKDLVYAAPYIPPQIQLAQQTQQILDRAAKDNSPAMQREKFKNEMVNDFYQEKIPTNFWGPAGIGLALGLGGPWGIGGIMGSMGLSFQLPLAFASATNMLYSNHFMSMGAGGRLY